MAINVTINDLDDLLCNFNWSLETSAALPTTSQNKLVNYAS